MLKDLVFEDSMEKEEWEAVSEPLKRRLAGLQQKARTLKIPMVIVFEGWGASGKGSMISKLIANLDPRGYSVHSIIEPTADERRYPWMRRFWQKLPLYGDMAIFDRSWYRAVSIERMEEKLSKKEVNRRFDAILDFERQMVDDGYLLLKFFLHISKKEQRRRFEKLESKKETRWRVTDADWKHYDQYDEYLEVYDDMLERTDLDDAPWMVVPANDKRGAMRRVFTAVVEAYEKEIARRESGAEEPFAGIRCSEDIEPMPAPRLREVDLSKKLPDGEYRESLKACQKRLFELHNRIYQAKIPVILAFEGSDAAGKGGNIKRISQALDPRGFEVIPICAPSPAEKNRQYLWRFWQALPKEGHIAIFDRTWYGRVMVEHIEHFCTDAQWGRAYDEINHFEKELAEWGAVVLKFWLQIDQDEQLRRFRERQETPEKRYKITDEDWRNREKWEDYEAAVDEMLLRTNTRFAPWTVVESNDKHYARIKTMRTIIEALEARL